MKLGYCRCSPVGTDAAAQQVSLAECGVAETHIFLDDGFAGKTITYDGLKRMLEALRPGDELVVPAMDRLAENARATLRIVGELVEIGARLTVGGTTYLPGSAMTRGLQAILTASAEAEGGPMSPRANARETVRIAAELVGSGASIVIGGVVHEPDSPSTGALLDTLAAVAGAEDAWIAHRTAETLAEYRRRRAARSTAATLAPADDRQIAEAFTHGTTVTELSRRFATGRLAVYRAIARHQALVARAQADDAA